MLCRYDGVVVINVCIADVDVDVFAVDGGVCVCDAAGVVDSITLVVVVPVAGMLVLLLVLSVSFVSTVLLLVMVLVLV